MKTLVLILKGFLLGVTILLTMLYICGIDSLYDNNILLLSSIVVGVLLLLCYILLTEEDVNILTFNKNNNFTDEA
jgi:hypothetical protein